MEQWLLDLMQNFPIVVLFTVIFATLYLLSKGADILVDEAVSLSIRWGIPKVIIGATIVSLGTTLPEVTVSVAAAIGGNPDIALGNAVGSIICNTSLIIGIAVLIKPLPVHRSITDRQSTIQLITGVLVIISAISWTSFSGLFSQSGSIPQWVGFVFLFLLVLYLLDTFRRAKTGNFEDADIEEGVSHIDSGPIILVLLKLSLGLFLIIIASKILLPTVQITAIKLGIPNSIIAATLIAFGTSLPELITAIQATRKGHGELAVGNVIGADILNVLFVIGASAAVTRNGLTVPPYFYWFHLPIMLGILIFFKFILHVPSRKIKRLPGIILLVVYVVFSVLSYLLI